MLFTSNANKGKEIKKAPNAALPSGLGTSAKAGPGGGRGPDSLPARAPHAAAGVARAARDG